MVSALEKRGHKEEAIEKYRAALKINPKYTTALNGIAVALSETGHRQEAIENIQMALRIMPNYAEAHHNLAVELAQSGREEEAVAEFEKAIQLKPNHPETYADLALAYASLNRPADALATADKAMNCAPSRGRSEFIQQFQPWLNEYRASLSRSGYTVPNSDHSSPRLNGRYVQCDAKTSIVCTVRKAGVFVAHCRSGSRSAADRSFVAISVLALPAR